MTKLRNGSSVEVLRREHDPGGSWFPGTIISASRNHYVVKYKFLVNHKREPVLEKVHVEDVRPQPPHETGKRWMVSDIAEVFDSQCWRVGKVAKVLRKNWFVIRLFGSIQLKEFHECNMRIQQSWHNNKWSVIGKVARDKQFTAHNHSKHSSDLFFSVPLKQIVKESRSRGKDRNGCYEKKHDHSNKYCQMRTINRSFAYHCETSSNDLLPAESHKKRKSGPCAGGCNGTMIGTLPLYEQVGNIHSPRARMLDVEMVNATNNRLHVSSMPHWSNEDSNECSIASCSSNDFPDSHRESLENESNNSDAESSFPSLSGKKHIFPSPRYNLDVDIHELELHAYESTVQALYASGPLSWEQESLLTNLRLSLNISDDEHLLQLRHLLSSQKQLMAYGY
ncbi:uncharacterized protein LOC116145857 [Pistacia vera]|uniref:uncharacterized protein LOC116145857 n=1 Tax=Pistacia vera TaxID=55513 RepID=UPI001263972B|nr:uncharacterized protein LOC116145857 [Pistacia vera]XP_031287152.1 uncharacterized protein LOC116145857 [Pistacia vera]XP_031287153.1 uncharacterized protein LOC116145857 [Pistacia vera]